jgi:hypothetical protein
VKTTFKGGSLKPESATARIGHFETNEENGISTITFLPPLVSLKLLQEMRLVREEK